MNKHVIITISLAIFMAMTACQPQSKEGQNASTAPKDTAVTRNIKPTDTGYADVNGLKLYYEVYGQGKPVVLLHGSFMSIPLN